MKITSLVFVTLTLAACGGSYSGAQRVREPLGLYEVTARVCANPLDEANECQLIQYVELSQDRFTGIPPGRTAFATWNAPNRHSNDFLYSAVDIPASYSGGKEYVIRNDDLGREWLQIENGTPTVYIVQIYEGSERRVLGEIRLNLQAVSWTAALKERLAPARE